MKCCCAQTAAVWEDPDATLEKIRPLVSDAARSGASLISFPEQFATGWDPHSIRHAESVNGTIVGALQELARKYRIAILGSLREDGLPSPRNTAVAIGPDGQVTVRYAKIHLFSPSGEDKAFLPGSAIGIFTLGRVRFGIAICYDLRFPDIFRLYAARGVHAVIVPSAWPESRLRHWEIFLTARAAENQMYMIGVNTTGTNPVDTYAGASMAVDPQGTIVARAGQKEGLTYVEIDPGFVDSVRSDFPVHSDRRDALYQQIHNNNQ